MFGVAASLAVIGASYDPDPIASLLRRDTASLALKLAVLVLAGALVLTLFRERLSRALETVAIWAMLGLLLVLGYTYRFELRDVAERAMAEVMPGRAQTHGRLVELARTHTGDFPLTARINGARVPMVLDTGASAVVLTQDAAKAAGVPLGFLSYTVTVETANGRTYAAPVTLDRLAIGGITERSVQALIAQPGQLKASLLGMSFLNRLESWEVRGDKLLLRGYP